LRCLHFPADREWKSQLWGTFDTARQRISWHCGLRSAYCEHCHSTSCSHRGSSSFHQEMYYS